MPRSFLRRHRRRSILVVVNVQLGRPRRRRRDSERLVVDFADEAVAFDFGSSNGWDMFTIYVLRGSGDIFFFCPVVPNGCAVSSALLPDEMRRGDPSSSQLKVWLDEVSGRQFVPIPPPPTPKRRNATCSLYCRP